MYRTKTYGLNMGYEMPNQAIGYVWEGNDPSIWDEYWNLTAEPLVSQALFLTMPCITRAFRHCEMPAINILIAIGPAQ